MRNFRNNKGLFRFGCSVCMFLICAALPTRVAPQGAGERVMTNFEVLEQISAEAIEELILNMPRLQEETAIVLQKEKGIGEIDFIFSNTLLKWMEVSGFAVVADVPDADSTANQQDYRFSFQIIRMDLEYSKIERPYWFGAKEVTREAEVAIFAQLIKIGSGDIIWVGDTEKRFEDVFPYSLLDEVEDEQYEFTQPPRSEVRWTRIVEPLIVTGIVVGLVFLFFSNQSNE